MRQIQRIQTQIKAFLQTPQLAGWEGKCHLRLQLAGHLIHAGTGMAWWEMDYSVPGWQGVAGLLNEQVVRWKGSQTSPRWNFILQMSKWMPGETVTYQRAGGWPRRDPLSSLPLCGPGPGLSRESLPLSPLDSSETNPFQIWIYLPGFTGSQGRARPWPVALGGGRIWAAGRKALWVPCLGRCP